MVPSNVLKALKLQSSKTCCNNSRHIRAVHTIPIVTLPRFFFEHPFGQLDYYLLLSALVIYVQFIGVLVFILSNVPQDVKIIGVTCLSNDAQMHTLSSTVQKGLRLYSCRCRGTMGIAAGNKMFCYIHYWECRLLT